MIKVTVLKNMQDCQQLQSAWQELTELPGEGIFRLGVCMSFEWTMALWKNHLNGQPQHVLVAEEAGEVLAILPCYSHRSGSIPGLRFLTLLAFPELYYTRSGLLCRPNRPDAIAALLAYRGPEWAGWTQLVISVVAGSPSQELLDHALRATGLSYSTENLPPSPYIDLTQPKEEFFSSLDKKFLGNLSRRQRNFINLGKINFVVYQKTDDVPNFGKIIENIERASWKEKQRTSITANSLQMNFYKKLLPHMAAQKWFFGIALWVDEKAVAYGLRLHFNDVLECLKTSYVDEHKRYSPGNILMSMLVDLIYKKNIKYCDLQGNTEKNKMEWTKKTYYHKRYTIYRGFLFLNLVNVKKFFLKSILKNRNKNEY